MIDKLKELEGLSYSVGDLHDTSEESKQRLEQLRKEINQSLKLEELVKEKIKYEKENDGGWDMSNDDIAEMFEDVLKESKKSGNNTFITNKQKSI